MKRDLGPLKLELINNDVASFYRFFYRKNSDNNDIYSIRLENIVMKTVDLHTRIFTATDGLQNYLDTITNSTTNVSASDISFVKNNIRKFNASEKSCLEIIMPIMDGKNYSQNDINEIYNIATLTLGI